LKPQMPQIDAAATPARSRRRRALYRCALSLRSVVAQRLLLCMRAFAFLQRCTKCLPRRHRCDAVRVGAVVPL